MNESIPNIESISNIENFLRNARDLEFNAEEEEIRKDKIFYSESETKEHEILKAAGFDLNALEILETEDARQAELNANSIDLQTTQVGLLEAPEFTLNEYEEELTEDMIQAQMGDIGVLAIDPWRTLGPGSHSCGNDRRTHNEGGRTEGISECQHSHGKSLMYTDARGDGSGIADDNDVYLWSWHWYFWYPRRHGHVLIRPYVQYHGYAYNRANDKWYNSKDTETQIQLNCDVWQDRGTTSTQWKRLGSRNWTTYHLAKQNWNKTRWFNRETHGRTYGNEVVWANKWVAIRVENKISAKTEGSGSYAKVDFRNYGRYVKNWVKYQFSY